MPEEAPTPAVTELALLQKPPVVVLANVIVAPTQTAVGPVISAGNVFTVTVLYAVQPVGNTYDIRVVPVVTGVNTPVVRLMVAIEVLVLYQFPPVALLL